MTPREYDVVRLIKTLPGLDIPIGSEGTVLIDHAKHAARLEPAAYEVEFTDEAGATLAVATVPEDAVEVVWRSSGPPDHSGTE